jgi:hypothetical protein
VDFGIYIKTREYAEKLPEKRKKVQGIFGRTDVSACGSARFMGV